MNEHRDALESLLSRTEFGLLATGTLVALVAWAAMAAASSEA
jgi:hypothetical protein